jgi:hypothetical protein
MEKDTTRPPEGTGGRRPRLKKPLPAIRQNMPVPTVLDVVKDKLKQHVIFHSEHEAVAVTLWIAATHGQVVWDHATRLVLRSAIKGCGKSRVLDLTYGLAHNVLMTANVSVAALVHTIGDDTQPNPSPPTILVDEADTIFGRGRWGDEDSKALRGLLNAGFQRNRHTSGGTR